MNKNRIYNREKNTIDEIETMIDYLMNPVYEITGNVTVEMAVDIFRKDVNLIIINKNKLGKCRVIDKDIFFDLLLKDIGKDSNIFEYGSEDFCELKNLNNISSIKNRYIMVRNFEHRVTGIFKRTYLNKLSGKFENLNEKNIMKIVKKKLEDNTFDIIVNSVVPMKQAIEKVERELITMVMRETKSTYKAAKILDVSQSTIARKSKKYNDELLELM
jgi:DNA-binding protein Fis